MDPMQKTPARDPDLDEDLKTLGTVIKTLKAAFDHSYSTDDRSKVSAPLIEAIRLRHQLKRTIK